MIFFFVLLIHLIILYYNGCGGLWGDSVELTEGVYPRDGYEDNKMKYIIFWYFRMINRDLLMEKSFYEFM